MRKTINETLILLGNKSQDWNGNLQNWKCVSVYTSYAIHFGLRSENRNKNEDLKDHGCRNVFETSSGVERGSYQLLRRFVSSPSKELPATMVFEVSIAGRRGQTPLKSGTGAFHAPFIV